LSADFTEGERKVLRGADNAAFVGDVMVHLQIPPLMALSFIAVTRHGWGCSTASEVVQDRISFKATAAMLNTPERLDLIGSDTLVPCRTGPSADRTMQVLISNYETSSDFKPHQGPIPANVQALNEH
jgi:hypothetical protein